MTSARKVHKQSPWLQPLSSEIFKTYKQSSLLKSWSIRGTYIMSLCTETMSERLKLKHFCTSAFWIPPSYGDKRCWLGRLLSSRVMCLIFKTPCRCDMTCFSHATAIRFIFHIRPGLGLVRLGSGHYHSRGKFISPEPDSRSYHEFYLYAFMHVCSLFCLLLPTERDAMILKETTAIKQQTTVPRGTSKSAVDASICRQTGLALTWWTSCYAMVVSEQ